MDSNGQEWRLLARSEKQRADWIEGDRVRHSVRGSVRGQSNERGYTRGSSDASDAEMQGEDAGKCREESGNRDPQEGETSV